MLALMMNLHNGFVINTQPINLAQGQMLLIH
jgi:hypothetical protein